MPTCKVLISIEILELERPARLVRQEILSFLQSLAEHPTKTGDYEERDEVGRPVQIKIIGNHALTYWVDHAVKEVKVIKFEKADRN